jgi:hypothetical protein
MTSNPQGPRNQRRLSSSDIRVNRAIGILVLLAGAALVYSLVFTEFAQRVQFQWELNEEGERVPVTHIMCPSAWSVTVDDAQPEAIVTGDLCVLSARGNLIQGVMVGVVALAIAAWIFTRTTRPGPGPLPMMPPSLRARVWRR